jgi:hypothetical protein
MEYTFYKIYSNPQDLTEFKFAIFDEGGLRDTFTASKFNEVWNREGNPEIIIESGTNEIDIIDGVPTLNLAVIKENRKGMLRNNPISYLAKFKDGTIEISCSSLNELQNLLLYADKNGLTEIAFKDYSGKIQKVTIDDIRSFIDQLIAYQLLLNQIQMKNEQIIDAAKTYEEITGISKIEVDNTKELEAQITAVSADIKTEEAKPIVEVKP